jgi:hypothetical protein
MIRESELRTLIKPEEIVPAGSVGPITGRARQQLPPITRNPVMSEMAAFLMRFYGLSEGTALELVGELRDKTSLQSLAGFRRVARAVSTPHRPFDL